MAHPQYTQKTLNRFWAKVNKDGPIPEHRPELGPCWEWTAYRMPKGYGHFGVGGYTVVLAHRFSYVLANGAIPPDLQVLHACDNPSCVNPTHLSAGTPLDNSEDMVSKERSCRGENRPNAVVTEDLVREIRALHARGVYYKALTQIYDINPYTLHAIVYRRSWRHVA